MSVELLGDIIDLAFYLDFAFPFALRMKIKDLSFKRCLLFLSLFLFVGIFCRAEHILDLLPCLFFNLLLYACTLLSQQDVSIRDQFKMIIIQILYFKVIVETNFKDLRCWLDLFAIFMVVFIEHSIFKLIDMRMFLEIYHIFGHLFDLLINFIFNFQ